MTKLIYLKNYWEKNAKFIFSLFLFKILFFCFFELWNKWKQEQFLIQEIEKNFGRKTKKKNYENQILSTEWKSNSKPEDTCLACVEKRVHKNTHTHIHTHAYHSSLYLMYSMHTNLILL